MAVRIVDQPWLRQPQEAVLPAAQYVEHMGSLLLPALGLHDIVANKAWTTWGTAPTLTPGPLGVAVDSTAAFGGLQLLPDTNEATSAQTHILVVEVLDTSAGYAGLFACSDSAGATASLALQRDVGNNYWQIWPNNSTGTSFSTAYRSFGPSVLILTGGTDGTQAYVNGVQNGTTATSPSAQSNSRLVLFGERSASASFATKGRIYLYSHLRRKLVPEEIEALSWNPWSLFEEQRIWVPVTAGGGALLDIAGSRTASLTGAVTATGDLQYAINLAGAQTANLSGALTVSGDIQITPAPTLDLAGSQTATLAGVLSATGDLQYTLPVDLAASAAALSGSLSIAGDLEYSTAVFLDIAAQPITLAGAFSASGDLDPYPSLNLSGAQSAALSGVIAASGNLQYTVPFDVSQTGTTALTGTLNLSGDLEYSTTPVPPPVSPGWGGGAVGGGGRGLRELTARIGKDAEDLLERKRKVPEAADQAKAASPDPTAQRVAAARSAKNSAAAPAPVAQPSQSDSPAEILSELRSLRGAVEKLEALILADREEARKRREQDEEEAAVVKLLLN